MRKRDPTFRIAANKYSVLTVARSFNVLQASGDKVGGRRDAMARVRLRGGLCESESSRNARCMDDWRGPRG